MILQQKLFTILWTQASNGYLGMSLEITALSLGTPNHFPVKNVAMNQQPLQDTQTESTL